MNNPALLVAGALVLGFVIAGASYVINSKEEVAFACYRQPLQETTYNTHTKEERGFPFTFYSKDSLPKEGGCQTTNNASDNSKVKLTEKSKLNKVEFIKDFAVWSLAFLVFGAFIFEAGKEK